RPCSVRWRRPRGNAARATTPADRSRRPPRSASVHRPTRPGCAACPTIPARSSGRVSATNTCAAARGSADMPDATAISCRVLLALALLLAVAWPAPAQADVRAWLDRDRIGAGETVTLNIETDSGGRPDYAPLEQDFRIEQRSSRQSYERHGGRAVSRTLFAAALLPRRDGVLTIPSLRVGAERTAPLTLTVAAAEPARARGAAWIEAELDDPSPYVQQAVALRLRLYYATQLVSGQLDQPVPEGAALQRAGADAQYTRLIDGRRYQVVERNYVLVPERSGRIEVPPARFRGRGVGGWFDEMFGDGQRSLAADGPALALEVRGVPAAVQGAWRPLRGLELRWTETPARVRAGEAFTVEVELFADGATAAQVEPPAVAAGAGAEVFPEPPQFDAAVVDGRPAVRMRRRFSVLAGADGPLRLEVPPLRWWDVAADRAREASLPALALRVEPGATGAPAAAAPGDGPWVRVPGVQGEVRAWALAAVGFALLWLLTLAWALHWRQRASAPAPAPPRPAKDPSSALRARMAALR